MKGPLIICICADPIVYVSSDALWCSRRHFIKLLTLSPHQRDTKTKRLGACGASATASTKLHALSTVAGRMTYLSTSCKLTVSGVLSLSPFRSSHPSFEHLFAICYHTSSNWARVIPRSSGLATRQPLSLVSPSKDNVGKACIFASLILRCCFVSSLSGISFFVTFLVVIRRALSSSTCSDVGKG